MKNGKLVLIALAILVAAMVIWFVMGLVISLVKIVLFVAVMLFAFTIIKKLSGKSTPQQIEENDTDRELNESIRQLEEIKRQQLIK